MILVDATKSILATVRSRRLAGAGQGGFTLLEALLAVAVSSIVAGTALTAFITTMRVSVATSASLTSSDSAFLSGSQFANDVSSVGPVPGSPDLVATGQPGCGGAESVLRLIGPAPVGMAPATRLSLGASDARREATAAPSADAAAAAGGLGAKEAALDGERAAAATGARLRVVSYELDDQGSQQLLRRYVCDGTDLTSALRADKHYAGTVVSDVAPYRGAVRVNCDGGEVRAICHVVEMEVRTLTERVISLRGTIPAVLQPTPTTTPAPPVAPPSGSCTIPASATTWGGTGGYAGSGDGHNGDPLMYTYDDTNQRNSYLRFDLTQPCAGAADTWPRLPGGRKLTSVTLKLAYMGKSGNRCWIFPGVSRDEQILRPLNAASSWTEAGLRGSNMPTGVTGQNDYKFNVANAGSVTNHTGPGIVETVKQWYTAGGWTNNGWILRRDGAGDTCGNANKFASRFESNTALRPSLVITWGP